MYRILNKSSSFDSVFKFYEETFFNTTADVSKIFPKYLLEFFIAESYVDQINLIYSFLNDISKPEFYEEILIVLDLKYSGFDQGISNRETFLRIILECMFFTTILSTERHNLKRFYSKMSYEYDLYNFFKKT
ncbi:hypothetical protein CWI39_0570p0010 [Hamiltosporidium magnivora]|uniref:Uncharacterized protein n=1 Tax=Hamiltosporidium magnivora TaxID=148818 RepID=A0A4Q9LFX4_9MICR|nr:hypothetical protein CWI39_0570p0010 [Hamiltosporidium magnivora]